MESGSGAPRNYPSTEQLCLTQLLSLYRFRLSCKGRSKMSHNCWLTWLIYLVNSAKMSILSCGRVWTHTACNSHIPISDHDCGVWHLVIFLFCLTKRDKHIWCKWASQFLAGGFSTVSAGKHFHRTRFEQISPPRWEQARLVLGYLLYHCDWIKT